MTYLSFMVIDTNFNKVIKIILGFSIEIFINSTHMTFNIGIIFEITYCTLIPFLLWYLCRCFHF